MDRELKIYIIEDHKPRRDFVASYFQCVNNLLAGGEFNPERDFKDCEKCFAKYGIQKVDIKEILPSKDVEKSNETYIDYCFGTENDWIKELESILRTKELRIFLIDFALNKNERDNFRKDNSWFIAETARNILDFINEKTVQKEYIIFESVAKNLVNNLEEILTIRWDEEFKNVYYAPLLGSYLQKAGAVKEKVDGINDAFENIMEEIQSDKST